MTTPATSNVPKDKTGDKTGDKTSNTRWKVKLSHPLSNRRVVFSSISESRARRFVANRFPRGEEAYLEAPDGTTESYQHERQGPNGEDTDQWASFDPDTYKPPEEQEPPGQSQWADVEG